MWYTNTKLDTKIQKVIYNCIQKHEMLRNSLSNMYKTDTVKTITLTLKKLKEDSNK